MYITPPDPCTLPSPVRACLPPGTLRSAAHPRPGPLQERPVASAQGATCCPPASCQGLTAPAQRCHQPHQPTAVHMKHRDTTHVNTASQLIRLELEGRDITDVSTASQLSRPDTTLPPAAPASCRSHNSKQLDNLALGDSEPSRQYPAAVHGDNSRDLRSLAVAAGVCPGRIVLV